MPRRRKTEDMSPPTILRWLKIYLVAVVKMIETGGLYREQGLRVVKGLKYAIKALEDSNVQYHRTKRESEREEYKEALEKSKSL